MIYFFFLHILCSFYNNENLRYIPPIQSEENNSLINIFGEDFYTVIKDMSDIIKKDFPELHKKIYGIEETDEVLDINMEKDAKELESNYFLDYIRNYQYKNSSNKILTYLNEGFNCIFVHKKYILYNNQIFVQYYSLLHKIIRTSIWLNNDRLKKIYLIKKYNMLMTHKEMLKQIIFINDYIREIDTRLSFMKIKNFNLTFNYLIFKKLFDKISKDHLPTIISYKEDYSYTKLKKTSPDLYFFSKQKNQKKIIEYFELFIYNLLNELNSDIDTFMLYQAFVYITTYCNKIRKYYKLFSLIVLIKNYYIDKSMSNISLIDYKECITLLLKICNRRKIIKILDPANLFIENIYKLRTKVRMGVLSTKESKKLLRMIGFFAPYLVDSPNSINNQWYDLESDTTDSMFSEESVKFFMFIFEHTRTKNYKDTFY